MANTRRSAGTNVTLTTRKRRATGAWTDLSFIRRRSGGAWVDVWVAAGAALSVSPSSVTKNGLRSTTEPRSLTETLTASGGTGTYTWSKLSGSAEITISATSGTSIIVQAVAPAGTTTVTYTATIRCTSGASTVDVNCSFTFNGTE